MRKIFRFIKEIIPVPPEAFADKVLQYYRDGFKALNIAFAEAQDRHRFQHASRVQKPRFAHEMVYGVGLVQNQLCFLLAG